MDNKQVSSKSLAAGVFAAEGAAPKPPAAGASCANAPHAAPGPASKPQKPGLRRRCIQLAAALLYNANLPGFASGSIYQGELKGLCVPGLNCYSCPGAVAACPLGALQNALGALPNKLPLYIAGFILLAGGLLGRVICGFACPFGLVQELLHKLPGKKLQKGRWSRRLAPLKYIILAVFVVLLPLWYAFAKGMPVPAFCKYICPAGTLEGGWPLMTLRPDYRALAGALFGWKTLLCLAILAACVFIYRAFCRFLCPLGAIWGLFSRLALLAVRVDKNLCIGCGRCVRQCKLDIRHVGDAECIQCGECAGCCPTGAISFSFKLAGENTGQKDSPTNPKKETTS